MGCGYPQPEHNVQVGHPSRKLINHGLSIAMGSHGKTWCRGWSLVVISDIKTTLPLVWLLRPANQREYTGVRDLVDMLLRLWPECPIEFLAGDSEYSQHGDLSLRLESSYGVHPAFYQRGHWARKDRWQQTDGTPTCSQHGLMKLYQSDGFVSGEAGRSDRREQGFPDGCPVRMDRARGIDGSARSARPIHDGVTGHTRVSQTTPGCTRGFLGREATVASGFVRR